MEKIDFINLYKITGSKPLDPIRKAIPSEAFSSAIEQFLDERFTGAINVRTGIISAQPILICADYAAYFFKILLTYVYGRVLLNVRIDTDEDGIKIAISSEDKIPLADSEMRELIRTARNAGFEIHLGNKTINLTAEFTVTATRKVYAVSIIDGKRIMLGKLVEIFCHGELMSLSPVPKVGIRQLSTRKGKSSKE